MATRPKYWTLEQLHRLPDDGNKYELVGGELFVTPPPSESHEDVLAALNAVLTPYVTEQGLGMIYRPRAVVRYKGSEVEPDLMVRARRIVRDDDWNGAPAPILVVEVLSTSTKKRDLTQKRDFYIDAGVSVYWIVDPEEASVRVVRPGLADVVIETRLEWSPRGASRPLEIDLAAILTPPTQ